MAVNFMFYSGYAQNDSGDSSPILDNRKQIGDPVRVAGGASTTVPDGANYAVGQGDADFKVGFDAAPHANSHTYSAGGFIHLRVRAGDVIHIL